jgi:hypothetical protein
LWLAVVLAAGTWSYGVDRAVNADGTVHTVSVENRPTKGANAGGTRLVHRVQTATEAQQSSYVPGTDEPIQDGEPSVAISPLTGLPALAWTRLENNDYEIYVSVYDGVRWSTPRALTANSFDDRKPQIVWGSSDYIHLLWQGPGGVDGFPTFYEAIIDRFATIVRAPALVSAPISGTITQTATTAPPVVANDPVLFAVDSGTKFNPRVSVYGGYDEPIPVAHRIDLVMPAGASPTENTKVVAIDGTTVVFAKSGSKLYYSLESPALWTSLRTLVLDSTVTQDKGELMVRDMISRAPTP